MFRRNPARTAARSRVAPTARPDGAAPFRYNADNMLSFPSTNLAYPGYTTWLSLREGGTVTVVTPYAPPSDPLRFRLVDLPFEHWAELEDRDGRPVPLALCADEQGVQGRWRQ